VDEAFFVVHVWEEALAAKNLRAVFRILSRLFCGSM
jgi:hypothetical protein